MSRQLSAEEFQPIAAHGPKAEYVPAALITAIAAITTIAASGNFTSPLYSADGYHDWSIGVTSSQTGAVLLLRYIDDLGQVALDTGQTTALVAATAAVLTVIDGKPFASYQLKLTNTGGSGASISAFAALTSAH
jgi:hypothetical protein